MNNSRPDIKRNILLNPGPATTSDSVKMAQVVPDICPREKEFGDLMAFISKALTEFVADTQHYDCVLFGGSGTAAVEAVISSVVPHDKQVLIINNGAYGQRMVDIAKAYQIDHLDFKSSAISPVDLQALHQCIQTNPKLSHLAVIHNETTTGLLNDLDGLGGLARKSGLELIVDAMSSYAAIPIDMPRQHIHYLCASSNKNIQGMAGVSFVIANKTSLHSSKNVAPRNFYLNLFSQYIAFKDTHQMRFTPPVQTLYALKQAIIETRNEGLEQRYQRYSQSWETLIDGITQLGLGYLVDKQHHSRIITSINMPENIDFNHMHDHFYQLGFTIYPGKVNAFNTFRIANIGEIDYRDIKAFLKVLKEYLQQQQNKSNTQKD